MKRIMLTGMGALALAASAALAAPDADRCTFDFREASRLHFEKEDPNAPNVVKSTIGFRRARMQRWEIRWSKDIEVEDDKLDALAVAEPENGYYSMLSPETMIPVAGGKEKASLLHNFAHQFVEFPDDEAADYRLSLRYRGNHVCGNSWSGAYIFLIDGETGDRRLGTLNLPDTGPDSDYWYSRETTIRLKKGHPKRCRLELRLDGVAYLKISNLKLTKIVASARPPVEMKCVPYGNIDDAVAIESGDVATLVLAWRARHDAAIDGNRDGAEVLLPRGFEIVGANVRPTKTNPLTVTPQADGTTKVRLPMYKRLAPERGDRFHPAWALSLLVRAKGPVGAEGVATFRPVRADGSALGPTGTVTLRSVEPIPCTMPKRFFTGTMFHYNLENFRWGEKPNEIYADYLRRHGSNWIIPQIDHDQMCENPELIKIWKKAGFAHITPQWHSYISNGYVIGNEKSRPEADRYKPPHGEKDYSFPGASCPAATYEERPFFRTNVLVKLEKATRGCDGMWHNWELHPFLGGCWCDRCMDRLKDWKDTVPHFQSDQHGKLCETLAREYKRMFGKDAPGFMPAISWADFCSAMVAVDYQKAKRPQDYFRFLDWIPAWGPYYGWEPNGPYNPDRGKSVWFHLAMADSKASLERICAGGKVPKLMAQPAGPNWLIQPEWLEIQMEASFFLGWQACIPWIFPYGCDARHWRAFCNAATMIAQYEDVVFGGARNDAATTVTPKPGFAQVCFKPDGTFLPGVRNVPLLQQVTYDYKGTRYVAVFNYDDESHCEFTLKTGGETRELSLPASTCRVFTLKPVAGRPDDRLWTRDYSADTAFVAKYRTAAIDIAKKKMAEVDAGLKAHPTNLPVGRRLATGGGFGGLFLWDSAFSVLWAKELDERDFPYHSTLDNFYGLATPSGFIPREFTAEGYPCWSEAHPISFSAPILAWAELELYRAKKSDVARLTRVYPFLKRHHEACRRSFRRPDGLYFGDPIGCGMDDLPRWPRGLTPAARAKGGIAPSPAMLGEKVRDWWKSWVEEYSANLVWNRQAGWIDLSCEMAFDCLNLAEIAEAIGRRNEAAAFRAEHADLARVINAKCWDENRGFYFDVTDDGVVERYMGCAYWALISRVATPARARKMVELLFNPQFFGRPVVVPSLAACDPDYDPERGYWRGSCWPPTTYVTIRGLREYGYGKEAERLARRWYNANAELFVRTGTVWENVSPEQCRTPKARAGRDFCGWSALVPIALPKEWSW